ncbi:TetR/AcrR family transcriptional regulator [Kineococcus rubinsiae]|uniref:TetR/AcrR family transcriptional regulator n=1 Tax=Kineococcus rubinsiae TaxID=2609562 RepID=UPI00142F5B25|nr:TetR family transcriptional regulator [Kineococcus rubinsiae]NIZ91837.1 TetR family transcriptional regulator [Kineococcus rubinsiae]
MSREDRWEQIVDAASGVVAVSGFAGTTTDAVAAAAHVSQPYVVRTFGGKQALLEAVAERCAERIVAVFRDAPTDGDQQECLGEAYVDLMHDRRNLMVLMHCFTSGDPAVARRARVCLGEVFAIVRERLGEDRAAVDFVAEGMLLNVLMAVDARDHLDEHAGLAAMTAAAGGGALLAEPGATGGVR